MVFKYNQKLKTNKTQAKQKPWEQKKINGQKPLRRPYIVRSSIQKNKLCLIKTNGSDWMTKQKIQADMVNDIDLHFNKI